MITTLHRYFGLRFLTTLVAVLVGVFALIILLDYVEQMRRLSDVPNVSALRGVHYPSVYLNRPEDEAEGQLNLVGRSLDTSRRFDALKVLIALRATGRRRMAELV